MKRNRLLAGALCSVALITLVLFLANVFTQPELSYTHLHFSYLSLIPMAGVIVNAYLLAVVVKRKASIKGSFWFATFLASTLMWSINDVIVLSNTSLYAGMVWRSMVCIPALLGVPALLMFVLVNTGREGDEMAGTWAAVFSTSIVLLFFSLVTNLIFNHDLGSMQLTWWGYEINFGTLKDIYLIWVQFLLIVIAVFLWAHYFKQKQASKKKQAFILAVAICIPILGSSITNMIPAFLSIVTLPIDSLFITVMTVMMYYGLRKYKLFTINPAEISENILNTMAETVIVTNPKFELQYANSNAERVFGITSDLSGDKRIDTFFAPQHFSRIREHLMTDPTLQTPRKFEDLIVIAQHTKVITPVDLSISSLTDYEGNLAGYVFVMADISALKHAYAQLAEEERRVEEKVVERTQQLYLEHAKLEASIASLPIGFIMLDDQQRVLEFNDVAKHLLKITSKTKSAVLDAVKKLNAEKEFQQVQKECVIADLPDVAYDKKSLHVIVAPIIGKNTDCLGSVVLIEDITKQKIAERERNEFIITASHEMRTPLTIIQGNLANALDPQIAKLGKEVKPLIEQAYSSTAQISELFKDILTVSEIDNGATPHYENKANFNLTSTVEEVIKQLQPKAAAKKIALSFSGHEHKIDIHGDPNELKEVIIKLTENGIKYTAKGYVSVELKTHGKWALLSVSDSGVGIDPDDRKRLFKKFARLDNKLTREVGGTGLGLYIAQSLAQRNGGEVILEHSTHKGSIFTLKLPLKP